jgi:hypothetical protein
LALIGLLLLMIAGLIIREAGQHPFNQPDSKANPKLSFRLCRMALFGLIWAVWFVLPALSSPPGIRYTYLSTVGVALLMAPLLAPVVQLGFMPSKTFFGIIRKSYDSLPVAGVKLLLVLGLAILSLLTIIPIQQQLAEASRITRLVLDQLHTLYPSLENYSLVYGAGLPDLSVDYNSTLILNPGFNEAVQLSYNNPLVQGIRVGAFPVVEQRLNQTRFVEYRAGKLVDREDIGAALQARNRNIKDKKEYAAFTWDFSQPQPAAGSGQMSPESWAIVGGSGTLTPDSTRRILRVELPNGGVFRPPRFNIGAVVLGNLELKLGAASLNGGSGNAQLIIHWLVETPGGLQERASAPLVIQADSLRHTYRLKPPDISAFLYDDKVSEIQIELSPGLASLEIEQARLYSLPEG